MNQSESSLSDAARNGPIKMLKYYSFSDLNDGPFRQKLKLALTSEKPLKEKFAKI